MRDVVDIDSGVAVVGEVVRELRAEMEGWRGACGDWGRPWFSSGVGGGSWTGVVEGRGGGGGGGSAGRGGASAKMERLAAVEVGGGGGGGSLMALKEREIRSCVAGRSPCEVGAVERPLEEGLGGDERRVGSNPSLWRAPPPSRQASPPP